MDKKKSPEDVNLDKIYADIKSMLEGAQETIPEWYEVLRNNVEGLATVEIAWGVVSVLASVTVISLSILRLQNTIKIQPKERETIDYTPPQEIAKNTSITLLVIIMCLSFIGGMIGLNNLYTGLKCKAAPDICTIDETMKRVKKSQ